MKILIERYWEIIQENGSGGHGDSHKRKSLAKFDTLTQATEYIENYHKRCKNNRCTLYIEKREYDIKII